MKALPRREVAETLIEFYFKSCEWMDTTVSERDFRRECADLWDHLDKRKPLEAIDPAWLALLFVKLATSYVQANKNRSLLVKWSTACNCVLTMLLSS